SPRLRKRLIDCLTDWFPASPDTRFPTPDSLKPTVLDNDRLDLAVARGAAYYGMVRRGQGVKIAASLARTYYIGIESAPDSARQEPRLPDSRPPIPDSLSALCLVPGNAEPGQTVILP